MSGARPMGGVPFIILAMLASLQPLALNAFAPVAGDVARSLDVGYAELQITLAAYLAAVAVAQLVAGQASDSFGRRPVLLVAVFSYVAGSALGTLAESLDMLLAARLLQGAGGGAAFSLVRTIVRDTSTRDEAASRIGFLTSATLVVPLASPALGGILADIAGWRTIFAASAALGALALAAAIALARETNPQAGRRFDLRSTFAAYPALLGNRTFLAYTTALSGASASFFCFVAAAPFVMSETIGASATTFGLWAAVLSVGYFVGNTLSGRYAGAIGSERLVLLGAGVSTLAAAAQVGIVLSLGWSAPALFLPMLLASAGNGLTLPGAIAMALSARPDRAGAASGLFGLLQLGTSAGLSLLAASVVTQTPLALPLILALCNLAALVAAILGLRETPREAPTLP